MICELEGMEFYAYHGCFSEEQAIGTRFRVYVSFEADSSLAQRSDNISDTISYLDVYQLVKKEMGVPSHLLEHVADRIGERLLATFTAMEKVSVKVSKLNPPLGGQLASVSVTIVKNR